MGDQPLEDPVSEVIPPLHDLVHQEILLQSELQIRHLNIGYKSEREENEKVKRDGLVVMLYYGMFSTAPPPPT